MKKTKTMRIAVLMLALTLLTCCFVGSTFAKYTSSGTGSDSVTVAKWQVLMNGTDVTAKTDDVYNEPTFDLFTTGANYDEAGNDVANERVAPGTKGSFNFKVQNKSEVSIAYTITFTVAFPTGIDSSRFIFKYNDAVINAVDGVYTVVSETEVEVADQAEKTETVTWEWTFGDDVDDTELGILAQNGTTVVTVTPTIVVEQVD